MQTSGISSNTLHKAQALFPSLMRLASRASAAPFAYLQVDVTAQELADLRVLLRRAPALPLCRLPHTQGGCFAALEVLPQGLREQWQAQPVRPVWLEAPAAPTAHAPQWAFCWFSRRDDLRIKVRALLPASDALPIALEHRVRFDEVARARWTVGLARQPAHSQSNVSGFIDVAVNATVQCWWSLPEPDLLAHQSADIA